jgi:hypothetical protein
MPLSSVVGAQSIVKPGVCTSSTRPASPYDGQVIYETDTDKTLVYNGTGWVFLSTSRANPGGFDLVKAETSFSAATQVICDSVFSSTYTAYKIIIRGTGTTGGAFGLRLRVGGVAASTNYNQQIVTVGSTTFTGVRQTAQTSYPVFAGSTGSFFQSAECLLTGPALAEGTTFKTEFQGSDAGYTVPFAQLVYGNHSTATAYDGFELNAASGNFTGVYSVFGIAK